MIHSATQKPRVNPQIKPPYKAHGSATTQAGWTTNSNHISNPIIKTSHKASILKLQITHLPVHSTINIDLLFLLYCHLLLIHSMSKAICMHPRAFHQMDFFKHKSHPSVQFWSVGPLFLIHFMVLSFELKHSKWPLVHIEGITSYFLPWALATHISPSDDKPTCFSQAVCCSEWHVAMIDTFNALLKHAYKWTLLNATKLTL